MLRDELCPLKEQMFLKYSKNSKGLSSFSCSENDF